MLFIGIQFVIWSMTGAYMVFFDIDYIHGDTLVVNHQDKINPHDIQYSLSTLFSEYPSAENIRLSTFLQQTVYRFVVNTEKGPAQFLLDARSGKTLSPISESKAIAAAHYYSRLGKVKSVVLITDNPPFELSLRVLPAWRINFDDFGAPSIYISQATGELVGKRHTFWRLFDWMFRFHVMDYGDAEDVGNWLLFVVAFFAILGCLLGLIMTWFLVVKPFKNKAVSNKNKPRGVL
ncbi:hypothetical protein CXF95_03000 [Paraglaciecola sp. MB-3u-78]|nr:hypothetical protein CXF95_03000 [Paraglaciecola sp. MB-3u-78]